MDREARLKYKRMKIATKRAQMSKEEKEAKSKENRERMARNRSQKSEEEKVIIRKENKERMARKREAETEAKIEDRESKSSTDSHYDEKQKNLYASHEKKFNRLYKRRIRGERSDAEHEYEKIYNLLCMRKLRSSRSADKHLIDKHESKLCMRLLKKEGRLKPILKIDFREVHELDI